MWQLLPDIWGWICMNDNRIRETGPAAAQNRIAEAFKGGKAFIGFLTGGDPTIEKTEEFILAMASAGADLVEIGIPFSDPVAEGEVIQRANARALSAGATLDKIFAMVERLRDRTQIPIVFLTYLNPVHFYGYDAFMKRCMEAGVDGLIVPDLPYEEREELMPYSRKYGVALVPLVAPTSEDRTASIASGAEGGYIYCVSSMGVTGVREAITTDLSEMVGNVRRATKLPVAVGFGISSPQQAATIGAVADGIIVGSAIVKIIERYGDEAAVPLAEYVSGMKEALAGL